MKWLKRAGLALVGFLALNLGFAAFDPADYLRDVPGAMPLVARVLFGIPLRAGAQLIFPYVQDPLSGAVTFIVPVNFTSGSNTNSFIPALPNIAALRGYVPSTYRPPGSNTPVTIIPSTLSVAGYRGPGTPGGGLFSYVASDLTTADDSCAVFLDSRPSPASADRWYRSYTTSPISFYNCGAVGNGIADDTAAINAAINYYVLRVEGGEVDTGVGTFFITSPINITQSGIYLKGSGKVNSYLTVGASINFTPLTINAGYIRIESMFIQGAPIGVVSGSRRAVLIGPNCVSCTLANDFLTGGYTVFENQGTDTVVDDSFIANASGSSGASNVYITNGTGYFRRVKVDQPWPYGQPAVPLSASAWSSGATYQPLAVYSLNSFFVQVKGTSLGAACVAGGTTPVLIAYGQVINDGTCIEQIAFSTNGSGIIFDNSSAGALAPSNFKIEQGDVTGAYQYAVKMIADSSPGTATPCCVTLTDTTVAQAINANIGLLAGANFTMTGGESLNCVGASCAGLLTINSWVGATQASNVKFYGNYGFGAYDSAGVKFLLSTDDFQGNGSSAAGTTTGAVYIAPGVTDFDVLGNNLGGIASVSGGFGVNYHPYYVDTGASSRFNISSNLVNAATNAGVNNATGGCPTANCSVATNF